MGELKYLRFYATMKKKKFDSDSEFTSKDDLDNELDEVSKTRRLTHCN